MENRSTKTQSGFTLIEIVVSIVILGIISSAVMVGIGATVQYEQIAKNQTVRLSQLAYAVNTITDALHRTPEILSTLACSTCEFTTSNYENWKEESDIYFQLSNNRLFIKNAGTGSSLDFESILDNVGNFSISKYGADNSTGLHYYMISITVNDEYRENVTYTYSWSVASDRMVFYEKFGKGDVL